MILYEANGSFRGLTHNEDGENDSAIRVFASCFLSLSLRFHIHMHRRMDLFKIVSPSHATHAFVVERARAHGLAGCWSTRATWAWYDGIYFYTFITQAAARCVIWHIVVAVMMGRDVAIYAQYSHMRHVLAPLFFFCISFGRMFVCLCEF